MTITLPLQVELERVTGPGAPVETTDRYLNFAATSDRVSTGDKASLDLTGDLELVCRLRAVDYTPAAENRFISKQAGSGNGNYSLALLATGALQAAFIATPSNVNVTSTAVLPVADNATVWVKVTLDVDNGAAGSTTRFYWAAGGTNSVEPTSWTQLGADIVTAGAARVLTVGTSVLTIGNRGDLLRPLIGKLYRVIIRNGIAGTVVADLNAANLTALAHTDAYGNAYTFTGVTLGDDIYSTPGSPGGALVWTDVTNDCVTVELARGRGSAVERYQSTAMRVRLYNPDGSYSPWKPAGAYAPMDVGTGVRLSYSTAELSIPLGTCVTDVLADDYQVSSVPDEGNRAYLSVDAVDGFELLANHDGPERSPIGTGELAGARIARLLEDAGWPFLARLDAGVATMQPTSMAGRTLDEVWLTADSDGGQCYVAADGAFVFRDVEAPLTDPRALVPQLLFADGPAVPPTHVPVLELRLATDREQLVNEARIACAGGTERAAESPSSIGQYGPRTFTRHDLRHQSDDHSSYLAQQMVANLASSARRIESLLVNMATHLEDAAPLCALELGDRIQLTHYPQGGWSFTEDLYVHGIVHRIAAPDVWLLELATGPVRAGDAVAVPQPPDYVTAYHADSTHCFVSWQPATLANQTSWRVTVAGTSHDIAEAGASSATLPCNTAAVQAIEVRAVNAAGESTPATYSMGAHIIPAPKVTRWDTSWPVGSSTLTAYLGWAPDPAAPVCPACGTGTGQLFTFRVRVNSPTELRYDQLHTDPVRDDSFTTAAVSGTWQLKLILTDRVGSSAELVTPKTVAPPTATVPPPAATNLRIITTALGQLRVMWNDPANPGAPNTADTMEVHYRKASDPWAGAYTTMAWSGAVDRTVDIPGSSADTQYMVVVRAVNEAGNTDVTGSGWTRPAVGAVKTWAPAWADTWTGTGVWRNNASVRYTGYWDSSNGLQTIYGGWGAVLVDGLHGHAPASLRLLWQRSGSSGHTGAVVQIAGHASTSSTKPASGPAASTGVQANHVSCPAAGAPGVWAPVTAFTGAQLASGAVRGVLGTAPNTSQANYAVWDGWTLILETTF